MSISINNYFRDCFRGLRTLVYPEICIMCQSKFGQICSECEQQWKRAPQYTRFQDATVVSKVPYDSNISSVVLKAKENRVRCAQNLLAESLYESIKFLILRNRSDFVLVPIPSSTKAILSRGESFLHPILDQVIEIASLSGESWRWRELLEHKRKVRDQAGLNSQQRLANLKGVFQMRKNVDEIRPIIVVDDVLTTGATLRNAILALNERKVTVLGAATACASAHQLLIR